MSEPVPAMLLLGGLDVAANQRYLRAAAARDLDVLVIDAPTPQDPLVQWRTDAGPAPADVAQLAAVRVTEIVDRAAAWSRWHDIRGVWPLQDEYLDAAALVADLLDLPSPGLRAVRACGQTYLRRRYLAAWSPRYERVAPARRGEVLAGWTRFPAAVGPVDQLAAPIGRPVRDAAELRTAFGAYGPNERLVLEEQAPGEEYWVDSLSFRGKVCHLEVGRKQTRVMPGRRAAEDHLRLAETHLAILARLAFDTGMAHAEYRQLPGRPPVLIGITPRLPDGATAPHRAAGDGTLEDAVIGLSVGEEPRRHRP